MTPIIKKINKYLIFRFGLLKNLINKKINKKINNEINMNLIIGFY